MKSVVLLLVTIVSATSSNLSFGEFVPTYYLLDAQYASIYRESYPSYENGILTIPRVDTPERPGMFQDAKFVFTNGYWQLVDFKIAEVEPLFRPAVSSVETVITDSFPVQVFLKIRGQFHQRSPEENPLGRIAQRLIGNTFEITIHENDVPPFSVDDGRPFETIVPLSTYALRAGVYQYILSGSEAFLSQYDPTNPSKPYFPPTTFTGTFELKKDNRF